MARVNRRLGGVRSILPPLLQVAQEVPETVTLLDVGTGNADMPRTLARALARRNRHLRWTGVDVRSEVLAVARRAGCAGTHEGALVRADGRSLPFPDGAFTIVTSSLMLHHLSESDGALLLREMARVARERVLVTDLERHALHYLAARVLGWTVWRRDEITKVDGPLSVLRSFTRNEAESLLPEGCFRRVRVSRVFPFRIVIDGEPR
jgi:ubiquinone/menaquinone biosynthesis C-methylase UbiE